MKVNTEISILRYVREQVEQFYKETGIPVDQVSINMVEQWDMGHPKYSLVTDVVLDIKIL